MDLGRGKGLGEVLADQVGGWARPGGKETGIGGLCSSADHRAKGGAVQVLDQARLRRNFVCVGCM